MSKVAQTRFSAPHSFKRPSTLGRASTARHILLALFFLTIIFDFRRLEGDSNPLVTIMGIGNVLLGAWYCVSSVHFTERLKLWVSPFFLLITIGAITGLIYDQELYQVLSRTVPIFSFVFASIAIQGITNKNDQYLLINLIIITCFASAIFKILIGFLYYDTDISNVRYQVLSGSICLLFSYGITGIFNGRNKFAIYALIFSVIIVLISVTRTFIIVFLVSAITSFYCAYSKNLFRTSRALAVLVVTLPAAALALAAFFPEIPGRWFERMSNAEINGFDVTGAYRLAEAEFQLQQLASSPLGMAFGFGHAADTGLAGENVSRITSVLGPHAADWSGSGYGHNFYVGLLYVGGVLGALPVMAAFIFLLRKGLTTARSSVLRVGGSENFLLVWGVSAMAGYLANGLLAGTFGDRSMSFFFGISAGLILLGTGSPTRKETSRQNMAGQRLRSDMRTPKERRAAAASGVERKRV